MRTHERMFESVVSCRRAYLGKSIEVLDKVVRLPDDRFVHRDVVTYAGGAVCVVAVTTNNQVVLVRQYRPAPEKVMLEIPAGRRNVREHFLTAAKRELREETGYVASSWEKCAEFWPSPGFVDERLALFVAKGLQPGPTDMDTDEFIHPILMPIAEAIEQCRVGHINDAKTLIGLLWYAVFEGLTGH
ncbi:NUDIX hydrolase [bacterium]|nr:NUDIX hydrolase [bacterium]